MHEAKPLQSGNLFQNGTPNFDSFQVKNAWDPLEQQGTQAQGARSKRVITS